MEEIGEESSRQGVACRAHRIDLGLVAARYDLVHPAAHCVGKAAGVVQLAVRLIVHLLWDECLCDERPAQHMHEVA